MITAWYLLLEHSCFRRGRPGKNQYQGLMDVACGLAHCFVVHRQAESAIERPLLSVVFSLPGRCPAIGLHNRGPSHADVTEGSGGIWERLHYDWSDPNHVVLKTTGSNTWGGASGHTYTFMRRPDGLTDIDVVVVRDGKNLKRPLLGLVVGTIGKSVLERAFVNSAKAIEARNAVARERGAA